MDKWKYLIYVPIIIQFANWIASQAKTCKLRESSEFFDLCYRFDFIVPQVKSFKAFQL